MVNMGDSKLFIISGHSGSGKTSLMREIMDNELMSFTTRPMRKGEVNGVDYHFISEDEYLKMLCDRKLAEHNKYSGNYYGITKREIKNKFSKGDAFAIVDMNGALQLKEILGEQCVSIFLYTDYSYMIQRLKERGDTEKNIIERSRLYNKEVDTKRHYDYTIKNNQGKFDITKDILYNIIKAESEG